MTYLIVAIFMVTTGILLARYETHRTRRTRAERLRTRARRCVRRDRVGY